MTDYQVCIIVNSSQISAYSVVSLQMHSEFVLCSFPPLSLLHSEQQRQVQHIVPQADPTTSPHQHSPSPPYTKTPSSHNPNLPPHQSMSSEVALPGDQRNSNTSLPYSADASLSPMPAPIISPAREEGVRYLQEVNK